MFSENRIEAIKEGRHAVPDEKWEMARKTNDQWRNKNRELRHKSGSKKMGSRAKPGIVDRNGDANRHGFISA
jgi:hypothetical protein